MSDGVRNISTWRITTMRKPTRLGCFGSALIVAVALAAGPGAPAARAADDERAARILNETGIRGGLVVHLGGSDGKLTAALHAGPGYLVQGLYADDATVELARNEIR
ncbi:MAG: hypothetical protein HQ582_08840, partial [Planctomycetes bacterium]|nr:hypothetical protein [Planctomycetota bacterium]